MELHETGQEMCLPAWLTKYRPAAALWKVSHGKFEMTWPLHPRQHVEHSLWLVISPLSQKQLKHCDKSTTENENKLLLLFSFIHLGSLVNTSMNSNNSFKTLFIFAQEFIWFGFIPDEK